MILPSFLVIGAAKSGTTALHASLSRHPEVCLPSTKETNFFAFEGRTVDYCGPGDKAALAHSPLVRTVSTIEEYAALFDVKPQHRAVGEVCPLYLYDVGAPARIRHYVPDVRLLAVLRHPVDRAFSAFQMLAERGREPLRDFTQALSREGERRAANWEHAWHYAAMSRYSEQISRYYSRFPRDQIHVLLHEELEAQPAEVLRKILSFIGVDDGVQIATAERHNASGMPRSEVAFKLLRHALVRRLARGVLPVRIRRTVGGAAHKLNTRRMGVDPATRVELTSLFRDDILQLQDLIRRDLSHWLTS